MRNVFLEKATRVAKRKADALVGRLRPLQPVLDAMAARPYELHYELTNLCNANCIFCPYQFQTRKIDYMPEDIFGKALADYRAEGGGSVFFTPVVGDALIHPKFLERVRRVREAPEVDRIHVTTNAILVDRYGADAIIRSGLTGITISTAGFDAEMYERVYRSKQYKRMRANVLALLKANREAGDPVNMVIGLRADRPLKDVMADPDFQEILAYKPQLDFTWSFTTAGGRIKREALPAQMRLRSLTPKREPCVQTFNGPLVLPDGTVLGCNCVAAMDGEKDLAIGNVMETPLGELWRSEKMRAFRASFGTEHLNETCKKCDMYRDLELYRTSEGRTRAQMSRERAKGRVVKREQGRGAWIGG